MKPNEHHIEVANSAAKVVALCPAAAPMNRRGRHLTLLCSAWFAFGIGVVVAEPSPSDAPTWQARLGRLAEYMHRAEGFGFSGALLVADGDRVVFRAAYGYADRAHAVRNTPETAFPIASITKPFTAAVILKLQEQGKLATSDPINRYLPDVPPDKSGITLHQLLTHTAGLADDYEGDSSESWSTALKGALAQPLAGSPGSRFAYSNLGYGLLASIAELRARMPFRQLVKETILDPVGMQHTGYLGDKAFWQDKPAAHTYNRNTDFGSAAQQTLSWQERGAGGIATTVDDLLAFWSAFKSGRIVSDALVARAFAPHARVRENWTYGYGWHRFKTKYGDVIYHGGNATPNGVTAELRHYPDRNITTILLVNVMRDETGYNRAVRDGFAAILFGQEATIPPAHVDLPQDDLTRFVGTYDIPDLGRLAIKRDHAGLSAAADGQGLIDFMSNQGKDAAKLVESLNDKALALVGAGCAGNPGTIERDDWKELTADPRPCADVHVVGTILPAGKLEEPTTFVRTRRSPERIVRCVWFDDDCYLLDGPGPVELYRLQPISPQTLVGYDLFTGNKIELALTSDDARPMSIALTAGGRSVTGRRVN